MSGPVPFDPIGPLPEGRVVLEASAGTGKTWNIAALVTRFVAEEAVPIEQILVVTFTRAATGELRHRIRDRLAAAHRCLTIPGWPPDEDDPVLETFAGAAPDRRQVFRSLLQQALSTFDRATITTLHGFAARLLRGLGLLSGAAASHTLAADYGALLTEAISDWTVARFAASPEPPLGRGETGLIAAAVLGNLDACIVPGPGEASGPAETRSSFARDLRRELRRRSEQAGILTYDDLLLRARDALADPLVGDLARRVIGRRFNVALIDEFQDTDRLQWEIADRLFPRDGRTLAIIGDPKQAIYAFRGADIDAYLTAADQAGEHYTLDTNWRSDQPLLDSLDQLLRDATFGDSRIRYHPVRAVKRHLGTAISGAGAPLQVRQVTRRAPVKQNRNRSLSVPAARRFIAEDVAAHAVTLLTEGAVIRPDSPPGERPLQPGDIAVLCRTHQQVSSVQEALRARGVPAVAAKSGDVLKSPAAGEWLLFLEALESPASPPRARRAALTSFVGWSPTKLAAAALKAAHEPSALTPEEESDDLLALHGQLRAWAGDLQEHGIPGLMASLEAETGPSADTGLTARLLALPDGERRITDLYHLAQLLHAARRGGSLGSLRAWLANEITAAEAGREEAEARTRRLETDAAAVQLTTIHGVKGLEFPVVLCPFLWDGRAHPIPVPVFHPAPGSDRWVDVGGKSNWDQFAAHQQLAESEQAAEEMRLMYVALTRARHHLVIWWAPCDPAQAAPISRVLFRGPAQTALPDLVALQDDDTHARQLAALASASRGTIATVEVDREPGTAPYTPAAASHEELVAAEFKRSLDHDWQRSSFTGLIRVMRERGPEPDAEVPREEGEAADGEGSAAAPAGEPEGALAFDGIRGGTGFGEAVHHILDGVDLTAGDLGRQLEEAAEREVRSRNLRTTAGLPADAAGLAADLRRTAETPLFPGPRAPTLREMAAAGWATEMGFELPVAVRQGSPGPLVATGDLADLVKGHLSPGHPLAGYAEHLRRMAEARFRGYLTGVLDVAARHPGTGAYWVLDYKTNRLFAPPGEEAAGAYRPGRLAQTMVDEDYVLQALLYQVALHRYLRFRLAAYDPQAHLGGALYLFLRGMTGPDTPEADGGRRGVFAWPAPTGLIAAVDDLLCRGRPA